MSVSHHESKTEFKKFDEGKVRLDLLPFAAINEVGKVVTHGAVKYGDYNWRKCPDLNRYFAAALRHLFAHMRGKIRDDDSGELHLSHAACNILFALELMIEKKPPPP